MVRNRFNTAHTCSRIIAGVLLSKVVGLHLPRRANANDGVEGTMFVLAPMHRGQARAYGLRPHMEGGNWMKLVSSMIRNRKNGLRMIHPARLLTRNPINCGIRSLLLMREHILTNKNLAIK